MAAVPGPGSLFAAAGVAAASGGAVSASGAAPGATGAAGARGTVRSGRGMAATAAVFVVADRNGPGEGRGLAARRPPVWAAPDGVGAEFAAGRWRAGTAGAVGDGAALASGPVVPVAGVEETAGPVPPWWPPCLPPAGGVPPDPDGGWPGAAVGGTVLEVVVVGAVVVEVVVVDVKVVVLAEAGAGLVAGTVELVVGGACGPEPAQAAEDKARQVTEAASAVDDMRRRATVPTFAPSMGGAPPGSPGVRISSRRPCNTERARPIELESADSIHAQTSCDPDEQWGFCFQAYLNAE